MKTRTKIFGTFLTIVGFLAVLKLAFFFMNIPSYIAVLAGCLIIGVLFVFAPTLIWLIWRKDIFLERK